MSEKILKAEVVVVGSGVAGALVAARLAQEGVRVLVAEAGRAVDRAAAVARYAATLDPDRTYPRPVPGPSWRDFDGFYRQQGGEPFTGYYELQRGGSTWHWLGTCLRFLPSDFRMRSRYGVGCDWPLAYADLEPFYAQAERELGVAGGDALGSPRSSPYPMPPLPATYLERELGRASGRRGYPLQVLPAARNSQPYQGRPACCGSASCVPVCPIGAKYDATVHLGQAERAGARIVEDAPIMRLERQDGRITAALARELRLEGRVFVLAANAVESPRLLLMSGFAEPALGRHLMGMAGQVSWALAPRPVWPYRSPQVVSGMVACRDGPFRCRRAAFLTSVGNDGWPDNTPPQLAARLIDRGLEGAELPRAIEDHVSRQLLLVSNCEELPDAENRISLAEDRDALGRPRPAVFYRTGDYTRAGLLEAVSVHARIFDEMGATRVNHVEESADPAHLAGTCRMGKEPRSSVVDPELRHHLCPNLFVLGSSVFPTVGTAPPTLTVAALALRAGPAIAASCRL